MIITVGESINTSIPSIEKMVVERDSEAIKALAIAQKESGATYLDVNCGTIAQDECGAMRWLVNTIQDAIGDMPLCIDSPEAEPLAAGLELVQYERPLMNSITGESSVFPKILPVVKQFKPRVIALCINDKGIPTKAEERFDVAKWLIQNLRDVGVEDDDIFIDPLIQPISANDKAGFEVLEVLKMITNEYPKVHKICGLSNISYGSPERKLLNRLFTVLTMGAGMDAFVLNPRDKEMMGAIKAAEALIGNDSYCMGFLRAYKSGLYEK